MSTIEEGGSTGAAVLRIDHAERRTRTAVFKRFEKDRGALVGAPYFSRGHRTAKKLTH